MTIIIYGVANFKLAYHLGLFSNYYNNIELSTLTLVVLFGTNNGGSVLNCEPFRLCFYLHYQIIMLEDIKSERGKKIRKKERRGKVKKVDLSRLSFFNGILCKCTRGFARERRIAV